MQCVAVCCSVMHCVIVCAVSFNCTQDLGCSHVFSRPFMFDYTHVLTQSCNTLQHTATHCNTPQHTAIHTTHCNTPQRTATRCNALQHTASLQHTATHDPPTPLPPLPNTSLHPPPLRAHSPSPPLNVNHTIATNTTHTAGAGADAKVNIVSM